MVISMTIAGYNSDNEKGAGDRGFIVSPLFVSQCVCVDLLDCSCKICKCTLIVILLVSYVRWCWWLMVDVDDDDCVSTHFRTEHICTIWHKSWNWHIDGIVVGQYRQGSNFPVNSSEQISVRKILRFSMKSTSQLFPRAKRRDVLIYHSTVRKIIPSINFIVLS